MRYNWFGFNGWGKFGEEQPPATGVHFAQNKERKYLKVVHKCTHLALLSFLRQPKLAHIGMHRHNLEFSQRS
jgi:hypothetical protein